MVLQYVAATIILLLLLRMVTSIHFDHQPELEAAKIDDERTDWKLPSKLGARYLSSSDMAPDLGLRLRLTLS